LGLLGVEMTELKNADLTHLLWVDQDKKLKLVENMETYGGSFVKALSVCILRADKNNLYKIISTWRDYINEYASDPRKLSTTSQ